MRINSPATSRSGLPVRPRPFIPFLLTIAALLLGNAASAQSEFRGLWVDAWGTGFLNQAQVNALVQDARENHFNAIIVQMRRRGDAFYLPNAPNTEPRTTALASGFDALAAIIEAAHSGSPRIEVHCWVTTFPVWSSESTPPPQPGHVFNLHPEFLMERSTGEQFIGEGYYVDPGHPEAMRWTARMAKDIVTNYEIDGFHWDYVRYPARDSGYNPVAIARFNEEFGRTGVPDPSDEVFSDWRRRQVTDFLRWINADLLEIRPGLAISAAVFSNRSDAYANRFQDWAMWNAHGLIDLCMPMTYTANNSIFIDRTDDAAAHQGIRHVYVGPGAYLNTKENTVTQLQYVRSTGLQGTMFYSYRVPNSGTVDRHGTLNYVRNQYQPVWSDTPALPWKSANGIAKGRIVDSETGQPVYNAFVTIDADAPGGSVQLSCVQGGFAFFDLPPGEYAVHASADHRFADGSLVVTAGQVTHLELFLGEGQPPETSRLTDFEDADPEAASGSFLFRQPSLSGSTSGNLQSSPNSTRITGDFPAGNSSSLALQVEFAFQDGLPNPWLRLTTSNTSILPNPIIPLDRALRFDVWTNQDVYIAVGIRDNHAVGPIGSDGGNSGPLEWAGGVTDHIREGVDGPGAVPPLGYLVKAGAWTRLYFYFPSDPVKSFTGNGVLNSAFAVFEHLAIVPVIDNEGAYSTDPFNIFLDNFELTFDPQYSTFEYWAGKTLPEGERQPAEDFGGYGIPNLLRYAFVMDPLHPNRDQLPSVTAAEVDVNGSAERRLQVNYVRRTNDLELRWFVESSSDLILWTPVSGVETVQPRDVESEFVTVTDTEHINTQDRRFLRVRVE